MVVPRNRFINDDDLSESTSLMHLLDRHDEEITEEANILKHSPFYSEQKFINILKKVGLCVLDLRKGIREAKRMYYRRTFHLYKK